VFAVYRLLLYSVPSVWLVADRVGGVLGDLAGGLAGRSLWVGATFGGLDFLVLMGALWFVWLRGGPAPRLLRGVLAASGILAIHLLYLVVLACAGELDEALGGAAPWNLPALAALLHLPLAGALLRGLAREEAPQPGFRLAVPATLLLAAFLPAMVTLPLGRSSLEGKKVVAFEKCFGNWMKPEHGDYGRLSIGMYGMLEPFVKSLGGEFALSKSLQEEELRDAQVLILLYPYEPWEPGQLERVERFVRDGGSLLVLGEHTTREKDGGSRFNDSLRHTPMQVRFDSATFEIGGWLQSYEALAHPVTAGVADDRNEFGVVIGASLELCWPARPLLIGKWGWADPGDEQGESKMGNGSYDPGEKLGDMVLAGEARLGEGTVVAFGDTSSFTNGVNMGSHVFTSRLLGYLASRPGSPQAGWRQLLGLLFAGVLLVLLPRAGPVPLAMTALVFAGALALSNEVSHRAGELVPDGRGSPVNRLAYIDTTHMERFDDESWRENGSMGLRMNLMRNGYLTLELREFTRERLMGAGLVVSVAPAREFSKSERGLVQDFVAGGGIFICTASYPDRRGCSGLLAEFGFEIGPVAAFPGREPQPMGHFKAPYYPLGDSFAYVRFHEAWPVGCVAADAPPVDWNEREALDERSLKRFSGWFLGHAMGSAFPGLGLTQPARVIAYGKDNHPVILMRRCGKGSFVVVGDSGFALNKNLERESGQAFEGMRENPDFWRWFLPVLNRGESWIPGSGGKGR
ncbi:MAG: DUF4350 domain-containing protein, partial [Planctomycetota bacterium]